MVVVGGIGVVGVILYDRFVDYGFRLQVGLVYIRGREGGREGRG